MEENNMNTGSQENQTAPEITPSSPSEENQKTTGSIVGIIIVVIIIVLGGFYFWGQKLDNNKEGNVEIIENTGETTEATADLEADLAGVDAVANDLEKDLNGIEAELVQ